MEEADRKRLELLEKAERSRLERQNEINGWIKTALGIAFMIGIILLFIWVSGDNYNSKTGWTNADGTPDTPTYPCNQNSSLGC